VKHSIRQKQARDATHLDALAREVKSLQVDFAQAKQASRTDGLTGAYNRAAFDAHSAKLVERHAVTLAPFSLLLLDVDNFKQINDTYGHPVGDRVLVALVQQCKAMVRKDDFLARYGGEEFALLLPTASLRHALKKARTLCTTIAGMRYTIDEGQPHEQLTFTVSIGVSTCRSGDTVASLIARADKALYAAKRLGKNRAVSEKQIS
jgi:diguanylate cyclase